MKNEYENLNHFFAPVQKEDHIEIRLPIVMRINNTLLDLKIYPQENEYIIKNDNDYFYNFNNYTPYYYKRFMKEDKNIHYDIQLENDVFFKIFPNNYNIVAAICDFASYFIYLNDFIVNNNIT